MKFTKTGASKTLIKTLDGQIFIETHDGKEFFVSMSNGKNHMITMTAQMSREQLELLRTHLDVILE